MPITILIQDGRTFTASTFASNQDIADSKKRVAQSKPKNVGQRTSSSTQAKTMLKVDLSPKNTAGTGIKIK